MDSHGGVGEVGNKHKQLVHVFFGLCLVGLQRAVGLFQAGYFGLGFVGISASSVSSSILALDALSLSLIDIISEFSAAHR